MMQKIVVIGLMLCGDLAFAVPVVSNVQARQRYPWNGLVDIDVTVTGCEAGDKTWYEFSLEAKDLSTNTKMKASTVTLENDNIDWVQLTNGTYRVVWNAYADLKEVVMDQVELRVDIENNDSVQLWQDGPKFAKVNIGAEKPEDAGFYFWWGDTIGYKRENNQWGASDHSSSNFRFYDDEVSRSTYGKDNASLEREGWIKDGNLTPEHDAATAHWGNKWRMPTADEISQLNYNCTWTWTSRNGMNGYEVRGKGDYANARIFIPAAGGGGGSSLSYSGSDGLYWSSSPYSGDSNGAYSLDFSSGDHYLNDYYRGYGFPVRAVSGFTK